MPSGTPGSGDGRKESTGILPSGRTTSQPGKELRREQIVLFVLANPDMTYEEIGKNFGCTKQNISAIMQSEDAKEVIRIARERLRDRLLESVEEQLDATTQLAVKALKRTLEADISPVHKAKANQDRVATKVLQGRGLLKTGPDGSNRAGFQVSPEMFDRLEKALNKADIASGIDPFAGRPVIEAEVVAIEDDKDDEDAA